MKTCLSPLIQDFADQLATVETAQLRKDVDSHIGLDGDSRPKVAQFGGGHLGSHSSAGLLSKPLLLPQDEVAVSDLAVSELLDGGVIAQGNSGIALDPLAHGAVSHADSLGELTQRATATLQLVELGLKLGNTGRGLRVNRRGGVNLNSSFDGVHNLQHVRGLGGDSSATAIPFQQRHVWFTEKVGNTVLSMRKDHRKAKPSAADKRAAKRLAAIWDGLPHSKKPTQDSLAEKYGAGANQSLMSQYKRGEIPLNVRAIMFFAEALGTTPEAIYPDHPDLDLMMRQTSKSAALPIATKDEVAIPRFDIKASMGVGLPAPDMETITGAVTVNRDWIRNELRMITKTENLALITGYGDSMEGTFNDGAQLIVDRGVKDVKVDAVYVLALNDELYIKRLQRRPDGSILMISDNRKYDPFLIVDTERSKFQVLGRVVGVWTFAKI